MKLAWLLAICVCFTGVLVACEPEATPLAIIITPTNTPVPQATISPPIRYAVADNMAGLIDAFDVLRTLVVLEQLSDDGRDPVVVASYDIIVGYGLYEDWVASPGVMRVALLLNDSLSPLDDAFVRELVRRAIKPDNLIEASGIQGAMSISDNAPLPLVTIRNELANYGYPDGFDLRLGGVDTPIRDALIDQLRRANFTTTLSTDDARERTHLVLLQSTSAEIWREWEVAYGSDNVISLLDLPISYYVADGIDVIVGDTGLPIPVLEDGR